MTEPTDAEIIALADETRTAEGGANGYVLPISFARAVLAKWGTPPAVARTETIELRRMLCAAHAGHLAYMDDGEAQDNREFPLIDFLRDSPPEIQDKLHRRALKKFSTPQPTQAQAGAVPLTADDLKQPRNGKQWRVEWWNESCRMLLPVDKKLDRFQGYRNGTLMFTIKDNIGIKGGQHGT